MLRPTRIRLRPWQSEALDRLYMKESVDFLAVATPGAGKTTFALAAAVQDLIENPGRRVIVVAPTQHLKLQWSNAASRFGLHLEPEWSARDGELPSDMHGVVTTYQQVSTSSRALATLSRGAFVILDEIHHAADDRSWGTAILEAFDGAAKRLSLSGTPFRSDTSAIPFVEYHMEQAHADYEYGYGEALADGGVVRPVYFPRINGFMEWVSAAGDVVAATFDDELPRELANQRLRTALSLEGEWLPTVLDQSHERLVDIRRNQPDAGGLSSSFGRPLGVWSAGPGEFETRRRISSSPMMCVCVTSRRHSANSVDTVFVSGPRTPRARVRCRDLPRTRSIRWRTVTRSR